MSILTKGSVTKGTPASFTLSKSALSALSYVAADSYYSDPANWDRIKLEYKSSNSKQTEWVDFKVNPASDSMSGVFEVSSRARGNFNIQNIVICDFDNDRFIIPRSQLTASEFDVTFGGGGAGGGAPTPILAVFTRDFSNPSSIQGDEYMTGTGLGNNISNNVLNLYVPDSGYNGGLYYAINPFPYSFASGKTYKIRLTFSEAPSSNARFQAVWNSGNGSLYRVFTQEELSQGFVELTGVTSATTHFNMSCNTTDAAAAYIRFSKYEVFEV